MPELKKYVVERGGLQYEVQATEEHAKEAGFIELKDNPRKRTATAKRSSEEDDS